MTSYYVRYSLVHCFNYQLGSSNLFFLGTGFLAFMYIEYFLPHSVKIQGALRSKCEVAESMKAVLCEDERQALIVGEYFKLDDGKECVYL